ncbi:tetratricopeptide repeat protein [Saprospira grandis]|nr:tetratricopeptide repeat protein [Saprospira grandis]
MKKWIYMLGFALALLLVYCSGGAEEKGVSADHRFRNLGDSATYVGMTSCQSCHGNVHQSYVKTGMGRSFAKAHQANSAADWAGHQSIFDTASQYYYLPFARDSQLYVLEYRLGPEGDTTHKRLEQISYIIGSGHHTNSHLINRNGYVYQAPVTYYTQDGRWDLAPGFEEGQNSRFDRLIAHECLTCHNHLPKAEEGGLNKYLEMPEGIECERCHGPGSIHVKEKLAGLIVDTSKQIDYSIVNPRHLSRELQMDLCQRCHLQGVAVLNPGKSFYDFKPGMPLSSVMQVFLPRFSNSDKRFIMASQADRLRLSPCYLKSEELSCISCHNPHHDVKSRTENRYNESCLSCHAPTAPNFCSVEPAKRLEKQDDCVSCHMPRSGSIDIPHVTITDHNISKATARSAMALTQEETEEVAAFLGLACLSKDSPSNLDMARGYLALYDKFMGQSAVLDSARYYLDQEKEENELQRQTKIHLLFAAGRYTALEELALQAKAAEEKDAWTAYRLGEACYRQQNWAKALPFFSQAVALLPYHLDFREKLGVCYARLGQTAKAEQLFQEVLLEDRKRPLTYANLGFIAAQKGNFKRAHYFYDKALDLDPLQESAVFNKAALSVREGNKAAAKALLERLAGNAKAAQALKALE